MGCGQSSSSSSTVQPLPVRQVNHTDVTAVNDLIQERGTKKDKIDINYTLRLSGDLDEDKQFISKAKVHEFQSFKKLEISAINRFTEDERKDLNELFEYATPIEPNFLKYLVLDGGDALLMLFIDALKYTLNTVTEEVYLKDFSIDESTLGKLLENTYKTKKLSLVD